LTADMIASEVRILAALISLIATFASDFVPDRLRASVSRWFSATVSLCQLYCQYCCGIDLRSSGARRCISVWRGLCGSRDAGDGTDAGSTLGRFRGPCPAVFVY